MDLTVNDLIPYAAMDVLAVTCGRERQVRGQDPRGVELRTYFRPGFDMSGGPVSDQLLNDGIAGTLDILLGGLVALERFSGREPNFADAFRTHWNRCVEGRDADAVMLFITSEESGPYIEGYHPDIQDLVERKVWSPDLLMATCFSALVVHTLGRPGIEPALEFLEQRVKLVNSFVVDNRHRIFGEAANMLYKARQASSKLH